ncbi:uncharacterized protein CTRU02_206905 [Colletotrichum truncatum]|uniref:Uncharacterized protein n=1 Tax=Colletotrichum truncatum TaxID=5467 RepID=A0ACC3YYZ7_COLTU|nr:uncharacterized protein CTRU02_15400 [Colletotrichum truncatum]KAF6781120.1 hypothetical protein CTRU02_15400 [Colletotrichum truncatum]
MCTIHIVRCPHCDALASAHREPCPGTSYNRLCHRGLTNSITTRLFPGRCEACLTKTGPYHTLAPGPTLAGRSSFESLSSTRGARCAVRFRMLWKRLLSRTRRSRLSVQDDGSRACENRCRIGQWVLAISFTKFKRGLQ